jgi:hypothetical protein
MGGLVAVSLVLLVSTAAVVAAARILARVRRAGPGECAVLLRQLRTRGGIDASGPDAAESAADRGRELVAAVLAAPPELRVATLNEALADVESELSGGVDVPRAAARIALSSGALGAVVEIAIGVGSRENTISAVLACFGTGAVGAILSFELGRRSVQLARAQRERWDDVARALEPVLLPTRAHTSSEAGEGPAGHGPSTAG